MSKRKTYAFIACLAGILTFAGCYRLPLDERNVQVGQEAPLFKLPDLNGNEVSLGQYKGKIVLIDFWATYCEPCRMTMPLLERLQKEYSNDMVLLAVNLGDTIDAVREFIQRNNLNSEILLDERGEVGSVYGANQIPIQFLIDKKGIVRHIQLGYSAAMGAQLRAEINKLR